MADSKSMMMALMGGKGPTAQGDGDTGADGTEMAAEDIIHAIKRGDAKMLVDALKNFNDMCSSEGDQEAPADSDY